MKLYPISEEGLVTLERIVPLLADIALINGARWTLEDSQRAREVLSAARWSDGAFWKSTKTEE